MSGTAGRRIRPGLDILAVATAALDPGGGGGDINSAGTGINPDSPAFGPAQATCFKLLPGADSSNQAAQQMAECMREHGVTGFPGPIVTATPPSVATGSYSAAGYGNGSSSGSPAPST